MPSIPPSVPEGQPIRGHGVPQGSGGPNKKSTDLAAKLEETQAQYSLVQAVNPKLKSGEIKSAQKALARNEAEKPSNAGSQVKAHNIFLQALGHLSDLLSKPDDSKR